MKETTTHIYFWGSIYSQWHKSSFKDESNNLFSSAEQFMMYSKAVLFGDQNTANEILKTNDPKKQKALGQKASGFNQTTWDNHKFDIVVKGNFLKFSQNENLKKQLISTNEKVLVEGSPYDKIWGVGLKWDDPQILNERNWKGENLLGKALVEVRNQLK